MRVRLFKYSIAIVLIMVGTMAVGIGGSDTAQQFVASNNITVQFMLLPTEEDTISKHYGGGADRARDSDGDCYSDNYEMRMGTDPNDPNSYPGAPVITSTSTSSPTPIATPIATPTILPTPEPILVPAPVQIPAEEEGTSRKTLIIVATVFILVILGTAAIVVWWPRR